MTKKEIQALQRRIEALEAQVARLESQGEHCSGSHRIERRRHWENLPMTLLIVILALLAANWVYEIVF